MAPIMLEYAQYALISLNMPEQGWIFLNAPENIWINCSEYAKVLNMLRYSYSNILLLWLMLLY